MEKHYKFSDIEFLQKVDSCELNLTDFTHVAHLRLAYLNICLHGIDQAEGKIQNQLKNFTEFIGVKSKYNVTLTIAAIKAVYHFILKSNSKNWMEFIDEFPELKYHFKKLLRSHYSYDIYNSRNAKMDYLHPDLLPFD